MEKKDYVYHDGCGCLVTFFAEADYRTSHLEPGKECVDHTGRYQVAERDCLIERANFARDLYVMDAKQN